MSFIIATFTYLHSVSRLLELELSLHVHVQQKGHLYPPQEENVPKGHDLLFVPLLKVTSLFRESRRWKATYWRVVRTVSLVRTYNRTCTQNHQIVK